MASHHLRHFAGGGVDGDGVEVLDAVVVAVELLGEVIHVVDQEASVHHGHRVADHEVLRREILLVLRLLGLHGNGRETS